MKAKIVYKQSNKKNGIRRIEILLDNGIEFDITDGKYGEADKFCITKNEGSIVVYPRVSNQVDIS